MDDYEIIMDDYGNIMNAYGYCSFRKEKPANCCNMKKTYGS